MRISSQARTHMGESDTHMNKNAQNNQEKIIEIFCYKFGGEVQNARIFLALNAFHRMNSFTSQRKCSRVCARVPVTL